jgi:hypothetical protein
MGQAHGQHSHPRPDPAPEKLIEKADVDLSELLLKIGQGFFFDRTFRQSYGGFRA